MSKEEYIAKSQIPYHLAVGEDFPIEGAQVAYKAEIDRIKPADVVPIVHCSECKHFRPCSDVAYGVCAVHKYLNPVMKNTDFCSLAELKTLPIPEIDDHDVSGLLDD